MKQAQRRQVSKRNTEKSSEQLLQQIRDLLSPTQKEKTRKHLSPEEIDQLLKQSLSYYRKQPQTDKPHLAERAQEAIKLIQKQHGQLFIQQYTKQKVYSDLFFNLRKELPENEVLYYQRQREALLRQRQHQEQEERRKQEEVIASRKKFIRYESNTLPYVEINEFTVKEGVQSLPYLINQAPQKQQPSKNNLIKHPLDSQLQQTFQMKKKDRILNFNNSRTFIGDDSQTIEVVDNDDTMNQAWYLDQRRKNINKMLLDNPKFVNIMKQILLKCVNLEKFLSEEESPSRNRNSMKQSEAAIKYTQNPKVFPKESLKNYEKLSELTRNYNSKGVILKEMNGRLIKKAERVICEKTISKMNGQSTNFHPKKAQLKEQQIYWCLQNEQVKENCKRIELVVQQIRTILCKKQEGGFFNKVQSQVQVVVVKSKNRELKFQKNFLQGKEFYKQLCMLMAQKLLQLNTLVSCRVNQQLTDFVTKQDTKTFSLASNFLQEHEKYPQKDYKLMIINVFTALFPFRVQITKLNLQDVKLNSVQLGSLIKSIRPLTKLQEIFITKAAFSSEILAQFFRLVSELPCEQVSINLSECSIEDSMLIKARESIANCINIQKLNLSKNKFSLQGFGILLDLSSKNNCKIKELNVSGNRIRNLTSLGQFVRIADKLQYLYAQDCGFSFDSQEQLSYFFKSCKNSKLKTISLLGNDPVNTFHAFEEHWVSENPQEIWIEVGTFAEKTSKNLQGKLLQP